uniref:Uncharacterized protein n=1 Tax=Oryza meridionalis TaxID=40149 RepID=A0A0E0CYX6_9ORYZ
MPERGSAGQRPAVDDDLDAVEHDRLLGMYTKNSPYRFGGRCQPYCRLAVASSKNTTRMASNVERRIGLSPEWAEAVKSNLVIVVICRAPRLLQFFFLNASISVAHGVSVTARRVFTGTCDGVLEEHWDMPPEQSTKTHASMRLAHSERRKKEGPPASAGAGEKDRRGERDRWPVGEERGGGTVAGAVPLPLRSAPSSPAGRRAPLTLRPSVVREERVDEERGGRRRSMWGPRGPTFFN